MSRKRHKFTIRGPEGLKRTYFGFRMFTGAPKQMKDILKYVIAIVHFQGDIDLWILDDEDSQEDLLSYYRDDGWEVDHIILCSGFSVEYGPLSKKEG